MSKPGGEKLATQWAFGEPSREAQLASVNNSCQTAIKTLMANMKYNRKYLSLDTLAKLEALGIAIAYVRGKKCP